MFYFIACIATNFAVQCTAPAAVETQAMCRALTESYRGAAQSVHSKVEIQGRCVPIDRSDAVSPPAAAPCISLPEIKIP